MNKHGQNQATVVLLMGPTASGKTELALQLSRVLACEIISVDSALVYRKMNIGTAKPTRKILQSVPHHLIDIRNPNETYSAAQFCDDANQAIERIVAKGRLPLLVGGTMLYFRSLQQGLAELPAADPAVRRQIEAQAQEYGWTAMHKRVEQVDPSTAARVHPNDPQRIQRALEVYLQTGRPMSELHQGNKTHGFPYTAIKIALAPTERANLHERIRIRFQSMLQAGFIEEVAELVREYALTPEMPAMRAVGYRQVLKFLHGELTYEEMQERGIIATRQLAKRQLTWLRSEQDLHWLDASNPNVFNGIMKIVNKSAH